MNSGKRSMRVRRPIAEPKGGRKGEVADQQPEVSTEDIFGATGSWYRKDHGPMPVERTEIREPVNVSLADKARTPDGRVAALSTVLIAGVGVFFTQLDGFQYQPDTSSEPIEDVGEFLEMTPSMDVEPFINKEGEKVGVRLELDHNGVEYGINFVDYTEVLDWELQPRSADEMRPVVESNLVYQVLHQQYDYQVQAAGVGVRYDAEFLAPPVKGKMDTAYDVYSVDNAREPDGIFRTYSEVLGNLSYIDKDSFTAALDSAKEKYGYGYVENLTYTDWMMRIDSPTREMRYDMSLVNTDSNTEQGQAVVDYLTMPVDKLYEDGMTTCTGYERIAISSFEQDNERYDLADRGMFRMTVSQLADARHAMGAYVLAHPTNPNEVYIIPVDVTNQRGNPNSDVGDVGGAEFASWMLSANVFHDLNESLDDRADVYEALLDGYSLDNTARAITVRELVITYIEQAEAEIAAARAEGRSVDNTQVVIAYKNAYNRLNTELRQESQEGNKSLLRPERALRLLFLQIELATQIKKIETEWDEGAVVSEYNEALRMYNQYVAGMKVTPQEGLRVLASIDEMDSGTQEMLQENLERELKRLKANEE